MTPKYLDPQLRDLVRQTVALLGEVIERNLGKKLYETIEQIRVEMTQMRKGAHKNKVDKLEQVYQRLSKLSEKEQFYVAHSFSLMLEIMNACENAYRTHVLKGRKPKLHERSMLGIYYVLTAHPTEARSPENVAIFAEMQSLLVESLESHFPWYQDRLCGLIEKAWNTPITRQRKPQVADEAEHIYSVALKPTMIRALLRAKNEVAPIYLRSWVGGDKDGHPGVNASTMVKSWQLSRAKLILFMLEEFKKIDGDLRILKKQSLILKNRKLMRELGVLRTIKEGDGHRVNRFRQKVEIFFGEYQQIYGTVSTPMKEIKDLFEMFPGLVVPLELRESSDLIVAASKTQTLQPISEMIKTLSVVCKGASPRRYVRGLIVSMCGSVDHVDAGLSLVQRYFKEPRLPVIPLFEQEAALTNSVEIVEKMLQHPLIQEGLTKFWKNRFEVMLGYSDSAKEVGALKSRLLISETVKKLEAVCTKAKVFPVFFHGSGGSVDRGGGSVQEQTAWLSPHSLSIFKATIQGEMVERTFSSKQIFRSGVDQLVEQINLNAKKRKTLVKTQWHSKTLLEFAERVSSSYKATIASDDFLEVVQKATPYRFLSALKLGSRPSRRGKISSVQSLRAIPWVLCWTQTRVLFPVWWGTGSAWRGLSGKEKAILQKEFKINPLLSSYVKVLGFTLAKVELPIWEMYLRKSGLPNRQINKIMNSFRQEYEGAQEFVFGVTQQRDLLWYRLWLEESIHLRSPMIHPLNLLQLLMMQSKDQVLLRESVAGIALGMLTTG